uniref:Movement protein n=1 Tax=Apple rubbery wood virus 1 TaxID=2164102 RepID=A0A514Y8U4_9VIRU|nr:movement protein [Apple rubbery wood virus 1]
MNSIRFNFLTLLVLMIGTSSGEVPHFLERTFPAYSDDENEKIVAERMRKDAVLQKAYSEAKENKLIWTRAKMDEYMNDNVDKADLILGSMYSLRDYRVKKTYEKDLQVQGGTTNEVYYPINPQERIQMSKAYKTVHLDGLQINCESLMPKGSEGFAILTLYDERFVSQEKGFLGLIGFPLGDGVSKATLKVNYSISTKDTVNWVAIITVYDHDLRDDMRPCNFHLKAFYKYTNNVSRFLKNEEDTEIGSFKIKIKSDKKGFAEESIRNSLDYSMSVLTNKTFMKKLSERELKCLNQSDISRKQNFTRQIPNFEKSASFRQSDSRITRESGIHSDFGSSSSKLENDMDLSELKIDFEKIKSSDGKRAFLLEELNKLDIKEEPLSPKIKLKF